ncbi:MAG: hypothetical protein LKF61_04975, partial [Eggerthellaceae bacterium]|nr:hypothetical protein [Eggerthellaceae bacterium]
METILIVGGKLQGVEIAYLAAEAGYTTILLDKNDDTPAQGLVSRTVKADVYDKDTVLPLITSVDAVIPAVEDYAVLE